MPFRHATPMLLYIDADVQIGADTIIRPNCLIESGTVIGSGCRIGPNTHLSGTVINDSVSVYNSVIIDAVIEKDQKVGPFIFIGPEK